MSKDKKKEYVYKSNLFNKKSIQINNITIDNNKQVVRISRQLGLKVDISEMTFENAETIGLINLNALNEFYVD